MRVFIRRGRCPRPAHFSREKSISVLDDFNVIYSAFIFLFHFFLILYIRRSLMLSSLVFSSSASHSLPFYSAIFLTFGLSFHSFHSFISLPPPALLCISFPSMDDLAFPRFHSTFLSFSCLPPPSSSGQFSPAPSEMRPHYEPGRGPRQQA